MSDYTPETPPSTRSNSVDSVPRKRQARSSKSLSPEEQEIKASRALNANKLAARKYRARKNLLLNRAEARSNFLEILLGNTTNELEQLKRILCYECREIHFHQGRQLEQDIENERGRQRSLLLKQEQDGQDRSSYGYNHTDRMKIEHRTNSSEDQNIDPLLMMDDGVGYVWVPRTNLKSYNFMN